MPSSLPPSTTDALASAAEALRIADDVIPSLPTALGEMASRQADAVREHVRWLSDDRYDLLFVGPVGVGKSFAVSAFANLLIPAGGKRPDKVGAARSILQVSAGRTTPCSVRVEAGEATDIEVTPLDEDELVARVGDMAHEAWRRAKAESAKGAGSLLPEESARVLRNMAGLSQQELRELAANHADVETLTYSILGMIDASERDNLRVACEASDEDAPAWLKATLAAICSGREVGVPPPARITVRSPLVSRAGLGDGVAIVDTKGGDHGAAVRGEVHDGLHDDRTVVVVCSGFAAFPDDAAHAVLAHARDVCGTLGDGRVVVLALERSGEAGDMLDEAGDAVADVAAGRAVKLAQARRILDDAYPGTRLPVATFDAGNEAPDALRALLRARLADMRDRRRSDLATAVGDLSWLVGDGAAAYLKELGEVLRQVADHAQRFVIYDGALPSVSETDPFRDDTQRNASVVWATTRRKGAYEPFDVHRGMADRYAALAIERAGAMRDGFAERFASTLEASNPTVAAVMRRLSAEVDAMPRQVGRRVHEDVTAALTGTLGADTALWQECSGSWGHAEERGGPYVAFVADNVGGWIRGRSKELDAATRAAVETAWTDTIGQPLKDASTGAVVKDRVRDAVGIAEPTPDPAPPLVESEPQSLEEVFGIPSVPGVRWLAPPPGGRGSPVPARPAPTEDVFISDVLADLLEDEDDLRLAARGPFRRGGYHDGAAPSRFPLPEPYLVEIPMPDVSEHRHYHAMLGEIRAIRARVDAFAMATDGMHSAVMDRPQSNVGTMLLGLVRGIPAVDMAAFWDLPSEIMSDGGSHPLSWGATTDGIYAWAALDLGCEPMLASWVPDFDGRRLVRSRTTRIDPVRTAIHNCGVEGLPATLPLPPGSLRAAICMVARLVSDSYVAALPVGSDVETPAEWRRFSESVPARIEIGTTTVEATIWRDGRIFIPRGIVTDDVDGRTVAFSVKGSVSARGDSPDLVVKATGRKVSTVPSIQARAAEIRDEIVRAVNVVVGGLDPVVMDTLTEASELERQRTPFRAGVSGLRNARGLRDIGLAIAERLAELGVPGIDEIRASNPLYAELGELFVGFDEAEHVEPPSAP